MVSFFKDYSLFSILTVIGVGVLAHLSLFIHPPEPILNPAYGIVNEWLELFDALPPTAFVFVYLVWNFLSAFAINFFANGLKMHPFQGNAVAMSYVLLSAVFAPWQNIIPALFLNILLAFIFYTLGKSYNIVNAKVTVYNIGFLTGLIILLYHPLLVLALVIVVAIAIIRPFQIQEWFIVLVGLITPYYFLGVYLFLTDQLPEFRNSFPTLNWHFSELQHKPSFVVTASFLALTLLLGVYYWRKNVGRMMVVSRKMWTIIFLLLLALLPAGVSYLRNGVEAFFLLLFPLSFFMANIFYHPSKSLLPVIYFWLAAAVIAANYIFY